MKLKILTFNVDKHFKEKLKDNGSKIQMFNKNVKPKQGVNWA